MGASAGKMLLRIRDFSSHSSDNDIILQVTPKTKIKHVRQLIFDRTCVKLADQKLFYAGKLLVDEHSVEDYNIESNDVVRLLISNTQPISGGVKMEKTKEKLVPALCDTYQVGDLIDYHEIENGAWFEAKIIAISTIAGETNDSDLIFTIKIDRGEDLAPFNVNHVRIRPRSFYIYKIDELEVGMTVLANYNFKYPRLRGLWYDAEITEIVIDWRNWATIRTRIFSMERDRDVDHCTLQFTNEIMRIEPISSLISQRASDVNIPLRKLMLYCTRCRDQPTTKCRECGCRICAGKEEPSSLIQCDECDYSFHLKCFTPPLHEVPEDDWYCGQCKRDVTEIVLPGEKLKTTKNKDGVVKNSHIKTSEDQNGAMKTSWLTRSELFDYKIHVPINSEIDYDLSYGVISIILDATCCDVDLGNEFYYNLPVDDANLIIKEIEKAFNITCGNTADCPFYKNDQWKSGEAVKIIRAAKYSKFAPKIGFSFAGFYKIVEIFPDKNLLGDDVIKYYFRRDLNLNCAPLKSEVIGAARRISPRIFKHIKREKSKRNREMWDECFNHFDRFFEKVEELFRCGCCCNVLSEPITTPCDHNICKVCLEKCFASDIDWCVSCTFELDKNDAYSVNKNLKTVLEILFP